MKFIICSQDYLYYTYLCEYEELQSKYKYFINMCKCSNLENDLKYDLRNEDSAFQLPCEVYPIKIKKVIAELSDSTYNLVYSNDKIIKNSRMQKNEYTSSARKFRINTEKRISKFVKDYYTQGYKVCMLHDPIFKDLVFEAETYEDAINYFKKIVYNLEFNPNNFLNSKSYAYGSLYNYSDLLQEKYIAYDETLKNKPKKLGFLFDEISILNDSFMTLNMEHNYMFEYDNAHPSIASKWASILVSFSRGGFSLEIFERLLDIVNSYNKIDGILYSYSILNIPKNLCAIQLFSLNPYSTALWDSKIQFVIDDFIKNDTYEEFIRDNSRYLVNKRDVNLSSKIIPKFLLNSDVEYKEIIKDRRKV